MVGKELKRQLDGLEAALKATGWHGAALKTTGMFGGSLKLKWGVRREL